MKSALALGLAATALSGCALGGRDGGYTTYDALAQKQRECAAQGGVLRQKDQANPTRIDGFACERK